MLLVIRIPVIHLNIIIPVLIFYINNTSHGITPINERVDFLLGYWFANFHNFF